MEQMIYELGLGDTDIQEQLSEDDADCLDGRVQTTVDRASPPVKAVCEPCDKVFTTKRAYLRHIRENKRHRTEDEDSGRMFKCNLCATTCARKYDLRRHQAEKHPDSTLRCESCGTHYRPGSHPEEDCAIWSRTRGSAVSIVNSAASAVGCLNSGISAITAFETQLLVATQALLTPESSHTLTPAGNSVAEAPPSSPNYQPQTNNSSDCTKNHKRPICGHCHKRFEKTQNEVMQHLARHRSELDLEYTCEQCNISFVREQDLTHHQQNAGTGNCGFCFNHVSPCSGHHPALCIDREAFSVRVRSWEQSQLQLFGRSVAAYVQYRKASIKTASVKPSTTRQQDDVRTVSVPSRVDYHTRMGEMMADFGNLQIRGRFYESNDHTEYACAGIPPPPLPLANTAIRRSSSGRRLLHPPSVAPQYRTSFAPPFVPMPPAPVYEIPMPVTPRLMYDRSPVYSASPILAREGGSQVYSFASKLLDASRDPNGQTMLHEFARNNNVSAITTLLEAGIALNDKDDEGCTALHTACDHGSYDTVVELIKCGAFLNDSDSGGRTPLHHGILASSCNIVNALLSEGADVNLKDTKGYTPLHLAFAEGNDAMVMALFSQGADVWATDNQGSTPSELARLSSHGGFVRQVALRRKPSRRSNV